MKALADRDTIKTLTTHYIDGAFVAGDLVNRIVTKASGRLMKFAPAIAA